MITHTHKDYVVHFYGKETDLDSIQKNFPNTCLLKQVHGDLVLPAKYEEQIADAHWTGRGNQTLLIQTADCLPVMLYLPFHNIILAIHAGWRGVQQKIVTKALTKLKVADQDPVHIYIGPHIQKNSFEVDLDVATSILSAHGLDTSSDFCFKSGEKYYLDLASLVLREIQELKLKPDILFVSEVDTKTDPAYNSFRAGDRGGRNYSLISKKAAR